MSSLATSWPLPDGRLQMVRFDLDSGWMGGWSLCVAGSGLAALLVCCAAIFGSVDDVSDAAAVASG